MTIPPYCAGHRLESRFWAEGVDDDVLTEAIVASRGAARLHARQLPASIVTAIPKRREQSNHALEMVAFSKRWIPLLRAQFRGRQMAPHQRARPFDFIEEGGTAPAGPPTSPTSAREQPGYIRSTAPSKRLASRLSDLIFVAPRLRHSTPPPIHVPTSTGFCRSLDGVRATNLHNNRYSVH
jgi:hypothetical protein